jgi:hypothetical protein
MLMFDTCLFSFTYVGYRFILNSSVIEPIALLIITVKRQDI